jgi:hypothetical protein
MGYYVNPRNESKEQFLAREGVELKNPTKSELLELLGGSKGVVCLVDNVAYRAVAICYCPGEIEAFYCADGRPKKWFLVSKQRLCEEGDIEMSTFEGAPSRQWLPDVATDNRMPDDR